MHAIDGGRVASTASLERSALTQELMFRIYAILARFPGATEFVINRPGEAMVQVAGVWESVQDDSLTADWFHSLATAVGRYSSQQINTSSPLMSAPLPNGERVQFVVPPAVEAGCISLTLRVPSPSIRTLADYQGHGYFDKYAWACDDRALELRRSELSHDDSELIGLLKSRSLLTFLDRAVRAKKNIAVIGDTGSGKTTLMKTMCLSIPAHERLITIEDVRELFLPNHPNRQHLLYSSEGAGQSAKITPAVLIKGCMRMLPSRVLLAELRGSEAFDFLDLLFTGHSGSITSFHAESCALAYERYALMSKKHADATDVNDLRRLISLTIDVIVHVVAVPKTNASGEPYVERYIKQVQFDPLKKLTTAIGDGATMHNAPEAA